LGPRKRKATTEESAAQSREEDTQSKETQHAQQQVVAKPPPEQKERPKFNGSVRDAIIQERIREAQDTIASLEESELKAEKVLKERINRLKQMYSRAAAAPSRRVGEMTCEDQRRATLSCLNDGSNPARCEELLLAFQNCTIETRVGAKVRNSLSRPDGPPAKNSNSVVVFSRRLLRNHHGVCKGWRCHSCE
jgi:hypothetical protein